MMIKKPVHILVMSSWSFNEPLTHSYLLPYLRIIIDLLPVGSKIWLQTMEKDHLKLDAAAMSIVMSELEAEGIRWIPFKYMPFGLRALTGYFNMVRKLRSLVRSEQIEYLHPFAPGAGTIAVFVRLFSKTKLVVDSWEPHAESMVESGVWKKSSLAFRVMWWAEKKMSREATWLIAATRGMKNYAKEKWNIDPVNVAYRPACVDLETMDPAKFNKEDLRRIHLLDHKIVCVCTGKLEGMYMGVETFQFFSACRGVWGETFHALILSETNPEHIKKMAAEAGFPDEAYSLRHVKFHEVPSYLAMADFAFNPQKPLPSKRFGTPVKDGEYWAMGLPVVIHPDISEDSSIVSTERIGAILGDMSHSDTIRVIDEIKLLLSDDQTAARCRSAAIQFRGFHLAKSAYALVYAQR